MGFNKLFTEKQLGEGGRASKTQTKQDLERRIRGKETCLIYTYVQHCTTRPPTMTLHQNYAALPVCLN